MKKPNRYTTFVVTILATQGLFAAQRTTAETTVAFTKIQLTDQYLTEGASMADVNQDGHLDVIAGPCWWAGPTFQKSHSYLPVKGFDLKGYANNFFTFPDKLTNDKWPDILRVGLPGSTAELAINPGKEPFVTDNTTKACRCVGAQKDICNESPQYLDLDGDGKEELLAFSGGHLTISAPGADATAPWLVRKLTAQGREFGKYEHGLGAGDIDGDGKLDVLTKRGWWQQPAQWNQNTVWNFHAFPFSKNRGGAQMFASDFDGDGDNDVVTSIDAHGWGLNWYEQVKDGNAITFKTHVIMTDKPEGNPYGVCFSQLHAMDLADVDGDGLKDIITGKCWLAHNGSDPGAKDPAVLYWFQCTRKADGSIEFVPHLIDDDSGVGRQISTGDMNADGKLDIVVGNKKGVFVFLQTKKITYTHDGPIFDGNTLKNWSGNLDHWRIEDGAIVGEIPDGQRLGKNEFLYFDHEVGNFDLKFRYRITGGPTANSGIQIRSSQDKNGHAVGYQADLDDGKVWLGRIYDEHGRGMIAERGALNMIGKDGKRHSLAFTEPESLQAVARKEDWNDYHIRCEGNRIEIRINDVLFNTLEDFQTGEADLSGQIAFQLHSGAGPAKLEFRDVHLKTLANTRHVPSKPAASAPAAQKKPVEKKNEKPVAGIVPPEVPNIGFEKGDLSGWSIKGDLAEGMPVKANASQIRRGHPSNANGRFFYGGYEVIESDRQMGTMQSAPFKVTHPFGGYLHGAGEGKNARVEIVLHETGEVLHSSSRNKGTESMIRVFVDLKAYQGKMISVRLVDETTGGWGHINYDDFRFYARIPEKQEQHTRKNETANRGRLSSSPLLWNLQPDPHEQPAKGAPRQRWVLPGFGVDDIASAPRVRQPIAFTFDAKGRIWVAEAYAYPTRKAKGEGKDRLVIFEDQDGDGTFESDNVFADNLNLISGFEIGYGGVFIGAAPEFLFLPDRDGDDVPDGPAEVLLDGFSTRDTHETPNSFMWGADGWLYGVHGVFNHSKVGKPGTPPNERIEIRAGVWRIHPVTHKFEVYAHGGSNPWGLDYNETGDLFMTHCRSSWGRGPVSQVFRDAHYWNQNNANHDRMLSAGKVGWKYTEIPLFSPMSSIAAYGHGEGGAGAAGSKAIFGGHSHVGTMIYLGDNWPDSFRGQLLTHNLHGHQMNREILERVDSAYQSSSHGQDVFYHESKTYLGVDLKVGPDGAVYSIDWEDKQQCHTKKEEAWDRSNGSILRMVWRDTYTPIKVNIADQSQKDWVKLLDHKNAWYARMALHQLYQAAEAGKLELPTAKALRVAVLDQGSTHRLRKLNALHAIGGWDEVVIKKLLEDSDEHIRAQTLHLITNEGILDATYEPIIRRMAASDPSSKVRLLLAGSATKRFDLALALDVIETLAMRTDDIDDRFIPRMLWIAASRHWDTQRIRIAEWATRTPLATLRHSILWQLAREDVNLTVDTLAILPPHTDRTKDIAVVRYGLGDKQIKQMPLAWERFKSSMDPLKDGSLQEELKKFGERLAGAEVPEETPELRMARAESTFALCRACHNPGAKLPGPSLEEIAGIYKTKEELIQWIKTPVKKRPEYPAMPPFPTLDDESLTLIAEYLMNWKPEGHPDR